MAENLRKARKAKKFAPEQEAELKALQQLEMDSRVAAGIAEAEEPPNPMEGSAGQSRIEQDLLMLQSGIGTKELLRRLAIYKKLVKLRKARKTQRFSPAQEAELKALQQVARDAIAHGKAKGKAYSAFSHCQKRKRCGET